jgi:hypothetical protein
VITRTSREYLTALESQSQGRLSTFVHFFQEISREIDWGVESADRSEEVPEGGHMDH